MAENATTRDIAANGITRTMFLGPGLESGQRLANRELGRIADYSGGLMSERQGSLADARCGPVGFA